MGGVTDDELTALEREHELLRPDKDRLREWGERHPELFSGFWSESSFADPAAGPVTLALAATAEPHLVRAEVEPVLERPDRLRVVRQQRTLRELREAIRRTMGGTPGRGTYIATGAILMQENAVGIGLSNHDEDYAKKILERFGADRVRVELDAKAVPLASHGG
jgi:hypothetical protein